MFAALIGIPILGNVLQAAGVSPPTGTARYLAMFGFLGLFLSCGFSAVPLIVKTVTSAQTRAGSDAGGMARHQNAIIYVMWGLMLAGR